MAKQGLICIMCWSNHGERVPAVALAAQDFTEREANMPTYQFMPVCEDHLSTWNDPDDEYYPAYEIGCLEGHEVESRWTIIQNGLQATHPGRRCKDEEIHDHNST